jgi:acetate CoA/acetoacetate CoA-transferase alpha subunit
MWCHALACMETNTVSGPQPNPPLLIARLFDPEVGVMDAQIRLSSRRSLEKSSHGECEGASSRSGSSGHEPHAWRNRDDMIMKVGSLEQAVAMIPDGASIMVGGFMGVGTPERLMDEVVRQGKRRLTVIANDTAMPGRGIGKLITAQLVSKAVVSHIGLNPETQQKMIRGDIEVDLVPQGTLIERIRAAGYGLGGILTPTGVGTEVEKGKRKIEVDGHEYLLETQLRADFALVEAFLSDYYGNLVYALTARNFNPVIAMAAATVVVDATHIVPVGVISPDHVVTPAALVDFVIAHE